MTQEDKQLLLKDLCARLPYGVKFNYGGYNGFDYTLEIMTSTAINDFPIEDCKPYLRPMSSMTEEEKNRFYSFMEKDSYGFPTDVINKEKIHEYLNWLLANHFDFMDLIPKGLAIAITERNNPYKD